MNSHLKKLNEFLEHPSLESLNDFQSDLEHYCLVIQFSELPGGDCRACPISHHNIYGGRSLCTTLVWPSNWGFKELQVTEDELGRALAALLRFKAWIEAREEEREPTSEENLQ
jgi:hypothetical protein